MLDPKEQGKNAFAEGLTLMDNPLEKPDAVEWAKGWAAEELKAHKAQMEKQKPRPVT